jgi:hypothetical protein
MKINALARSGQEDEFTMHLNDADAQFMLAALLRFYPVEMCDALMEMVNRTETDDAAGIKVDTLVCDGNKNNPLDKFCVETAIRLLVAKKSLCQSRDTTPE